MTSKLGFCCKFLSTEPAANGQMLVTTDSDLNGRSTTVAWLNRQTTAVAERRLWDIMQHNIDAIGNMVDAVAGLPPVQHMVRIGSETLPMYTQSDWKYFWAQSDVRAYCARHFAIVGARARELGIRLSFHPGQFCCIASENPDVVRRSLAEFEYHTDIARWMGYGTGWHDHGFKINIHMSGRRGAVGFRESLGQLSPEARNLITVENDENGHGLEDVLQVADQCAVVMDVHHHWIRAGEYIQPDDARVQQVIDSWRGVNPVMHFSQSREDLLVGHDPNVLPDMSSLLAQGYGKQKLRAHSDFLWNNAANQWARSFFNAFSIQTEAKAKNLASAQLAAVIASS